MFNKRFMYLFLGVSVFFFLSWYFANIFIYMVISITFATILRTPTEYLSRVHLFNLKLPRSLAIIFSFMGLTGVFMLFIITFIPLISDQVQILAAVDYENIFMSFVSPFESLEEFLIENEIVNQEKGFIILNLKSNAFEWFKGINITSVINSLLSFTGNFFVGVMAVLFITFILLYEKGMIRRQFIALIPNQYFEVSITAMNKIERLLSYYLLGLLFQMFFIFSIAAFGLSIFGIKYAITIALFAAVANLIPYAGPLLGSLFGIIVGVSSVRIGIDSSLIILVVKIVSVFAVVQLIDNMVLQPLIFSKSVKAHPLEIFVVIFAGATLAGVVGMVAAIPVYTIIRVSVFELYNGYKQYRIFKL